MKKLILLLLIITTSAYGESKPDGIREGNVDYKINLKELEKGNFQFFYCLLRQKNTKSNSKFENLDKDGCHTDTKRLTEIFLPLDINKQWDSNDRNYMAIAKFNYILPIDILNFNQQTFTDTNYIQKTIPKYKVTKKEGYFHVGGSVITPSFDVRLKFLEDEDPLLKTLPSIKMDKIKTKRMKVSLMQQSNFGKVMFVETAKMSSALIIYEQLDNNSTLVTQYIFSNVINVPAKFLIRKGMIQNLQDVAYGSRKAVLE